MPIDTGNTTWMFISTGLVMLMTPALGFFEAGLILRKNALSIVTRTFSGLVILSILWFVIGFTLVFGTSNNGFIGSLKWIFLEGVPLYDSMKAAPTIPGATYVSYEMMFAVITPLLIGGAFAGRLKRNSFFVFIIAWSFLVYYPLAHLVWGKGWLQNLGVFDFAGGLVVHTSAGISSLAAGLFLMRKKKYFPDVAKPSNVPLAVVGASLLWLGWFGFNAGSAFVAGSLSANAAEGLAANTLLVTHMASATSAMVWILLSWRNSEKSSTAAINGAIAGLAGVTPASGYISVQNSFILGIVLGLASYYGVKLLKDHWKINDALDVSSIHGITGIIGSLAVGIIASTTINSVGPNGLLYGNPMQLAIQALGVIVSAALAFGVTLAIMKVIDMTIGLSDKEENEEDGYIGRTQPSE